ncbi:MAG: NAD(P)H-binding protein [Pseudonocardiaceae bacterium]
MLILVTGATGTVGSSLVRQLVSAGHRVRALTRNPGSEAAARLPKHVEIVQGDFSTPETLVPALCGVERMHLVAIDGYGPLTTGPQILELAKRAGVRRITHLGHHDPSRADDDPLEADHRAVQKAIENSGLEWTHVFPGEFMANTWEWAESIKTEGVVRAPFGGWNSAMVHEADVAAVIMAALLEDNHVGKTYWPTGPEPVKRRDAVRMIGEAIGRKIQFIELTPAQAREHWKDSYPEQVIEWFLEMGQYLDGNAPVLPDLEQVTGKRGRTFAQWAIDHADDFR